MYRVSFSRQPGIVAFSSWKEITYFGYGKLRLKPSELLELEPGDFYEMVSAFIDVENERMDEEMQVVAWQTSILINAIGRAKKTYKPKDLYVPLADRERENRGGINYVGDEQHSHLVNELLDTFQGSI